MKPFKYTPAYLGNNQIIIKEEDVFISQVPLMALNKNEPVNVGEDVGRNVGERRLISIVNAIKNNNKISAHEISKQFSVMERTIERDFAKLKKANKIQRIGSHKDGYWQIIN